MANITPEELIELAKHYSNLSQKVNDFIVADGRELSEQEWKDLKKHRDQLSNIAAQLLSRSVNDMVAGLADHVAQVQEGTQQAKQVIENIQSVEKVINITTVAVNLGTSILSGNVVEIGKNTVKLVTTVAEATG